MKSIITKFLVFLISFLSVVPLTAQEVISFRWKGSASIQTILMSASEGSENITINWGNGHITKHNGQGADIYVYPFPEIVYDDENEYDITITAGSATRITYLGASNVVTIDVSQAVSLERLELDYGSFTTLDLSHNTALVKLECYNGQLATLNLEQNTALEKLYCVENKLVSLDLSQNQSLKTLDCRNNLLESLKIGSADTVYASYNNLTTLDVSDHANLKLLRCDNNKLETLNLGGASNLIDLLCFDNKLTSLNVQDNTNLKVLYCSNNLLTSLDLSSNLLLKELTCRVNGLTALDVRANTALTRLDCSANALQTLDLSANRDLQELSYSLNQISDLDLSHNTSLLSLACDSNHISVLDISGNTALTTLYCQQNTISTLDISQNKDLDMVFCYNNNLPLIELYAISEQVSNIQNKMLGEQILPDIYVEEDVPIVFDSVFDGENTVFKLTRNGEAAWVDYHYTVVDGNIIFHVGGTYTVSVSNPAIESANAAEVITTCFVAPSSDATLDSIGLEASNGYVGIRPTLTPAFHKDTLNYKVSVPYEMYHIAIQSATTHFLATSENGWGGHNLNVGDSIIKIKVTAEDSVTQKTYTLTVTRLPYAPNTDASLRTLYLGEVPLTPDFHTDTLDYDVLAYRSLEHLTINAFANDSKAVVSGDTGRNELNLGANTFKVVVTAEDTTVKKTYTIIVTRPYNSNADLYNLSVKTGWLTPSFHPDTLDYCSEFANNVDSVYIEAFIYDETATMAGDTGWQNLRVGLNRFEITVTAENQVTTKTYGIDITRRFNTDATLKKLSVSDGSLDPPFDKYIYNYDIQLGTEATVITVEAEATHPGAIVSGDTGLLTVNPGNNDFDIIVTAEDTLYKETYRLTVFREYDSNAELDSLTIVGFDLLPDFHSDTTYYKLEVGNAIDEVFIKAKTKHPNATVIGDRYQSLAVGTNILAIMVLAEDQVSFKYYTIEIYRLSSDATLQELRVNNDMFELRPEFSPSVFDYTLDINIDQLNIFALKADLKATMIGDTGVHNLILGDTLFSIRLVAEDTNYSQTYTIAVNYNNFSRNAYLQSLTVSEGTLTPAFHKDSLTYKVEVFYETDTLIISAQAEHDSATLTGSGKHPLAIGENPIEIIVTAENGTTIRTYTVVAVRATNSSAKESLDNASIMVYPNPVSRNGKIHVELPTDKTSIVTLYNQAGKHFFTKHLSGKQELSMPDQVGVYVLKVDERTVKVIVY